ncbi:MAG: hypothetical protein GF353_21350, partial [Candidatus Lokiarchaeota archaeon]|nr:hypothetical protein [Candidatus Lokiarchaeota archaeon]
DDDNYLTLSKKLSELAGKILPLVLEDILENDLIPLSQDEEKSTYCKKIKKEDGNINWEKSAEEIRNMVRAFTPWPSAYTIFNGKNIKILKAETEEINSPKPPGTFFLENKTLKIATKKGNILPLILQPEGKKIMDAESFINGYKQVLPTTKTEPAPDKEI